MESNNQSFQYSAPTWPYTSMVSSPTPSPSPMPVAPASSFPSSPAFTTQSQSAAESRSFNSSASVASSSSTFSSPVHSYSSSPSGSSYTGSFFSPPHHAPMQSGNPFSSPSSSPIPPSSRPTGFGSNPGSDIRFMPSMAAHFVPPRTTPEEDISAMLTGVSLRSDVEPTRQGQLQRDLPSAFMGMQLTGPTPESLADPMASMGLDDGGKYRVEDAAELMAGLSFGNGVGLHRQMQWLPGIDPNGQTDPGFAPMDMDVDHRTARGHTHHHQSYIN
ncbi:hypothetical protein BCR44DRAFT_1513060 [Catenaria anguillulae PL171]|uniref:Uncharacterized protein n=1 Tax=Catenaria anguillulae PL171 TaxID=765915 RepID=A0A1Y2HNM6_9FUNG|nr:hypothetical protein BCR44DRAFT_1513060 [Catenaria anguillulae PL171]